MISNPFNIYLTGVGGQGIGLISEIILRAADHAGHQVKSVDTHGLAQRGGIVVSQIRIGEKVFTPLIPEGQADLVVALERHEALRATIGTLKNGGTLVYYNTVWQPLPVRLNQAKEVSVGMINRACGDRRIRAFRVTASDLDDPRTQNTVSLSVIDRQVLIPGIDTGHYEAAMNDLMTGAMLEKNMRLFVKNTEKRKNQVK